MKSCFLVGSFLLMACSALFAEVPPNIGDVYPADGAKDVPINGRVWVNGESIHYSGVQAELSEKDSGVIVAVRVEKYPAIDFSGVDKDRDERLGVGASRYNYFYTVIPEAALRPSAVYQLRVRAGSLSRVVDISFTTGLKEDLTAPPSVLASGPLRYQGGFSHASKRRIYTLIPIKRAPGNIEEPLLVEVFKEGVAAPATFVVLDPGKTEATAVLEADVSGPFILRTSDLAGNVI